MEPLEILMVEDDGSVLEIVREYLTVAGHHVTATARGAAALRLLGESGPRFDAAVIDWHLPGISGRDVIDSFHERHPRAAVLVCTGSSGRELGGVNQSFDVVFKPFSLRDLNARIVAGVADVRRRHSIS
jgi:DNA-binding response OmpR family regulator